MILVNGCSHTYGTDIDPNMCWSGLYKIFATKTVRILLEKDAVINIYAKVLLNGAWKILKLKQIVPTVL